MCHIYDMSNMGHNQFQSFLICIHIYVTRNNFTPEKPLFICLFVFTDQSLFFPKVYSWRERRISFNVISYRFFFHWNSPSKLCMMLGYFAIWYYCLLFWYFILLPVFFFFMALQGIFLQRQMFRWCSNERVKWLEKENLMKLGANVTCQITDVFIPIISVWLPRPELCFLWWGKTHQNPYFISSEILISVLHVSEGVSVFQDLLLVFKAPLRGAKEHREARKSQGDPVLLSCWHCVMLLWTNLCSVELTS